MTHEFAEMTAKAGEDISRLCQSWTLNNSEELWVNTVELFQHESSHHSIWTYVPQEYFGGPDGVWECKERNYNELLGTIAGGVLIAQSTQASHEVQHFRQGAAIRIPPYSKVIGDIHLQNTTSQDVTGRARMTIYTIPKSDVQTALVPFEMVYNDLAIPPHAQSRFSIACDLRSTFQTTADSPFDMKIHYILPHHHQFATRLFLRVHGGPDDGRTILETHDYYEEGRGQFFDTPIDLTGASGITFGCDYDNPTDNVIPWGYEYGKEMCQMLGFAESKVAFLASGWDTEPGKVDNGTQTFTSACEIQAVAWDFDKPGGNPAQ